MSFLGSRLDGLTDSLRQLVASQRCVLCSGRSDTLLCAACNDDLPWNRCACRLCARPVPASEVRLCAACSRREPPFDAAVAAFRYAAPVDQAVQRLKYQADFLSARWLGDALAETIRSRGSAMPEILLPVPLHSGRLRRRGYNQAQEVARIVGRRLGIAVRPQLARRIRATEDQIGKTAAERRRNLRGAFAVDASIQSRHVALIDDVMTTGSTLAELAKTCRKAGARCIDAWVLARVE